MSFRINPNISVDCVVFGFDFRQLKVLLVERIFQSDYSLKPIFTDHTLIGNHIYEHEDLEEAARRILKDLTGIENIYLEQFIALAHPERLKKERDQIWLQHIGHNPHNRVITVGYFGLLDINAMEIRAGSRKVSWFPVNKLPALAFDHHDMLNHAVECLKTRMRVSTIAYTLLPKKFSLSQLQTLFEVIYGTNLDKRNFRKKMIRMKYLIPLNEKQSNVSHKPAQLYMFSREVYEITNRDLFENII
ncbi:MAG: NUDIX hydrolase [Cyclobacteriaceae bacterium]|nr:NUDIX hydrolase [Cyclobacteriaceae bacterium]